MNSRESEVFQEDKRMAAQIAEWEMRSLRMCYDYPLRLEPEFTAQVVLPRNMTRAEAERICAFIMTLAQP